MPHLDLAIYLVHISVWVAFGATRYLASKETRGSPSAPPTPEEVAPHSRLFLALSMVAFALMYFGLGNAVIPGRVPEWFDGQRVVGTLIMVLAAVMMSWALHSFRSWRFRAALSADHQLATGGPFHYVRHPIYLGLDLVALGSAVWVPTPTLWLAAVLMIISGDLRGRAEEKLLATRFGLEYSNYLSRTRRFIPGVY
jgi:protein-S-isoprenylcysteine O-methyltransferase Ste14